MNGAVPSKSGLRLRGGERIEVAPAPAAAPAPEAEALSLAVVHEDPWLAVVDKPPGLVVHPAAGHDGGTLVNALLHRYGGDPESLSAGGAPDRPGIVHRLDKDTSGLLVVARDDETHRALADLFARRALERRYLAVVLGARLPDEATFSTGHARHPRDRKRFTGRVEGGRRAVTHCRVVARSPAEALALLVCRLETGRTHQIRMHLAEAGHPVVADPLYGRTPPKGGGGRLAVELAAARRMPRQALHALTLGFVHPKTGAPLRFTSPVPADLAALLREGLDVDPERAVSLALEEP